MKKILSFVFLISCFFSLLAFSTPASARSYTTGTDCYFKTFNSDIVINQDSTMDVTDTMGLDCTDIPNKHGIFYMIPTFYQKTGTEKITTPIILKSITDEQGGEYNYTSSESNGILTWKIGDANTLITGINTYAVKYSVKNSIRFDSPGFDEFYWNIIGNFWPIDSDQYTARITFPAGITKNNVIEINKYDGAREQKDSGITIYKWAEPNVIRIDSQRGLKAKEGVTLSVTFPKNIISQPVLTFWEKYGAMILGFALLLIPIIIFLACLTLWWKYGRDIGPGRAVAPEFEIPDKRNPMEMSTFMDNGNLKSSAISAAIVNLAVQGYMKIDTIPKQGMFSSADTKLIRTNKALTSLSDAETKLVDDLFGSSNEVLLSDLRNQFYKNISSLKEANFNKLSAENLFEKKGFGLQTTMIAIAAIWFFGLFFAPAIIQVPVFYVISVISIVILFVFGMLMPKRSPEGEELLWKIKGFKMYMTTAEKYRQKFNEKENIFEKFLPYAMLFGITGLWISKMKQLYGERYFNAYHPIWYVGYVGNFNIDSFSSQISSLSSSMASTISSSPSSSGSGGGGFSGGGGGGSGGGTW